MHLVKQKCLEAFLNLDLRRIVSVLTERVQSKREGPEICEIGLNTCRIILGLWWNLFSKTIFVSGVKVRVFWL